MNILVISSELYPCVTGGLEVFNFNLIRNLSGKHKISVITSCKRFQADVEVYYLKKILPIRYLFPIQIFFYVLAKRKRIDLIYIGYSGNSWPKFYILTIIKKLFGIGYIFTIHGGKFYPWKPYKIYSSFFENAKEITAVSERACMEYKERSKRNITLIPPLIPFYLSEKSNKDIAMDWNLDIQKRYLLYVGSIKELKATDTLVDAFIMLGKDYILSKGLNLLIAGDGPDRARLEDKAKRSTISRNIFFLGNVPRDKVPELYRIATMYVITSEYENTSISLLEAMFNTKPIIASFAPGIKDIIRNGENGLTYEIRNSQQLASCITNYLDDEHLSHKLSYNAKVYYENNFNYSKFLNSFQKLFSER